RRTEIFHRWRPDHGPRRRIARDPAPHAAQCGSYGGYRRYRHFQPGARRLAQGRRRLPAPVEPESLSNDRGSGWSLPGYDRAFPMSKRFGLILFVLLAALFLIVNRGAYAGYFQDDEIDNLSWAPYLSSLDFLKGALTPRFQPNNFRPVGHYYFHAAEKLFGLDFPKYVAVIHA